VPPADPIRPGGKPARWWPPHAQPVVRLVPPGRRLSAPVSSRRLGVCSRPRSRVSCPKLCRSRSDLLVGHQSGEVLERTVIRAFGSRGKTTTGQLPRLEMIAQTLATHALARTRIIGTGAALEVLCLVTLHRCLSTNQRLSDHQLTGDLPPGKGHHCPATRGLRQRLNRASICGHLALVHRRRACRRRGARSPSPPMQWLFQRQRDRHQPGALWVQGSPDASPSCRLPRNSAPKRFAPQLTGSGQAARADNRRRNFSASG